ncbi:MAG: hypothetical protein H6746_17375 [Deltaproteobacteria bacterium]|nr:hypothetical protein [Deltaproteobacteria bacterium]
MSNGSALQASPLRRVLNLLGASEGCIGAFVTRDGECVASTRMVGIGADRMQLIEGIFRQLTGEAKDRGYGKLDFLAHFPAASILCYHLTDEASLIVLGMPGSSLKRLTARSEAAATELRPVLASAGAATEEPAPPTADEAPPAEEANAAPADADAAEEPTPTPPPLPEDAEVDEAAEAAEPPETAEATAAAEAAEAESPDLHALRAQALERFGDRLDAVCDAFISYVGPLGRLLFDDSLDAWLEAGPAEWTRVGELRDRLAEEIEKPRDRASFEAEQVWKG